MQKVYLFGGGNNAYGVIDYIGKEHIIAIIDNEPKKNGDIFEGIKIIDFGTFLKEYEGERVVITTAIYDEIIQQLAVNGIENYTVAPMVIMGLVRAEEIIKEKKLYIKEEIYIIGYNIISEKICELLSKSNSKINIFYVSNDEMEQKKVLTNGCKLLQCEDLREESEIIVCKEEFSDIDMFYLSKKNICYLDIYDYQNKEKKEYIEKMQAFCGMHKNSKCFIIGNGPSLKIEDLEKIQNLNISNFGLNLIYKLYSDTVWRPTYFVITEYNIYRTYYDEIVNLRHDNLFVKNFYSLAETPYIPDVNYYPGYARRCYLDKQKFSEDISKVVYSGYSVMYDAIQIATYMGFKEIYLIGADFSYLNDPSSKGNHVYDNVATDRRKVAGRAYTDITMNAFRVAKEYAEAHGIKIYNATRGGNLEIFERKNLDEVFEEIENYEM